LGAFGAVGENGKAWEGHRDALPEDRDDDLALLAEMVREAERVIDHQVRAKEAIDAKSQNALTVAIAALGGGLALGSLVLTRGAPTDAFFLAAIAAGGGLNLGSVLVLLDAYMGLRLRRELAIGPSVAALSERALRDDWTWMDHGTTLLASLAEQYDQNGRAIEAAVARRREGLLLLVGSLAAYVVSMVYILALRMGG
jgi:hypothetical protein